MFVKNISIFRKIYLTENSLYNKTKMTLFTSDINISRGTYTMNNMKIAIFHNLPSGGAKRALYGLIKYLTSSGHKVDVFIPETANETFLPLVEIATNLTVFPVKKGFLRSWIYSKFDSVPPVIKPVPMRSLESTEKDIAITINNGDYDVVLSEQDQFTMSSYFLKYIQIPTVYYCQQPPRNEKILEEISKNRDAGKLISPITKRLDAHFLNNVSKIDKKNVKYANYIVVNSHFSRESLLRIYGLNCFVSYLGIDTSLFKPLNIPKEDFVLSVGSCMPHKGYDFIIKSLAQISSDVRPKFIIVSNEGDELWRKYLENLAINLNVKLEILSLVDDKHLVELYNKAKLVLYAPYLEPFGLVPIESMGCGTPVIAVMEGGVRETVIHNETGLLTDRDEQLFAEATIELLSNDKKRHEMSQKAIEVVQDFWSAENAGKRLVWHLNRAIKNQSQCLNK